MRKQDKDFFEFLCRFIDIQIKKYEGLVRIGVGPDAGINATLVCQQVTDLLKFANAIMYEPSGIGAGIDNFFDCFNQTLFYLQQELRRGKAAWLIDENNIHGAEYRRLIEQFEMLQEIAKSHGIRITETEIEPKTEAQQQCKHDSYAIAFCILDLAVLLKKDPETSKSFPNVPVHAMQIMKKHATTGGRFHEPSIWDRITAEHQSCTKFLEESSYKKSETTLTNEQIAQNKISHQQAFQQLLDNYRRVNPTSKLFEDQNIWYNIGKIREKTHIPNPSSFFYAASAGIVLLLIYVIAHGIEILSQQDQHLPGLD